MKLNIRFRLILLALLVVGLLAGLALAQDAESLKGSSFQVVGEIGRALPQRLLYDANHERYAVIDAYGQLSLVDALSYEREHVLYEEGEYNDLLFSHDGNWLALAIGTRIELWNANTGELVSRLDDLSQALRVHGPLAFARDDNLLVFSATYPAPQATRRFENDTTIVPWLWNLTAARNEGDSTFPRRVEALPFYDYRNGFTLGPNNKVVTALPGRLHVLDATTGALLFDIPTDRFERDALQVWFSAEDDQIYVRTTDGRTLMQLDTERGLLVEIPLNHWLTSNDLGSLDALELSETARLIGPAASRGGIPLLNLLLGDRYNEREIYSETGQFLRRETVRLTTTLIDILDQPFGSEAQQSALLFLFDETNQQGYFALPRFGVQQMTINASGDRVLLRTQRSNNEVIETYDLDSGQRLTSMIPALRSANRYSPRTRNRVLAYTSDESQIISDFERIDAESGESLASDLRYSRSFSNFFFTNDNQHVVTLSGTEWRLWDITTGEVLERKVISLRGNIIATSQDGYRYLTRSDQRAPVTNAPYTQMEIYNVADGSRQTVRIDSLPGHSIGDVYQSPDWQNFLVIYTVNSYGPYAPGNQIAGYSLADGWRWTIAGDDLPFAQERRYGWVDNDQAYVYGSGYVGDQPGRIYDVDFAPNGLPACLTPPAGQEETWRRRWWSVMLNLDSDEGARLAQFVCTNPGQFSPDSLRRLANAQLNPTQTPVVIAGVPDCLTQRFPEQAAQYAQEWQSITQNLSPEQQQEASSIFCEAFDEDAPQRRQVQTYGAWTMVIDAQTGLRSSGNTTPPVNQRPISPLLREFERTEDRNPGTIILSPNEEYIAASSLPGELLVYRVGVGYRNLLGFDTATAAAFAATEGIIHALPTYTPTFAAIGTARPTLTPTVTLTPLPSPEAALDLPNEGQVLQVCPARTLYNIADPPPDYAPTGRIIGPVQGEVLWVAEPENGQRYPDPDIPACGYALQCSLSPDNAWILAYGVQGISVRRPDELEFRLLFDFEKDRDIPRDIHWSGVDTLEYEVSLQGADGRTRRYLKRDILGVSPDPDPWLPEVYIDGVQAQLVTRQPGGSLAIVEIDYTTGTGVGHEYFLYNIDTGEWSVLARETRGQMSFSWHALGDRLYYTYPGFTDSLFRSLWFQYTVSTGEHALLGLLPDGLWSPDGRYRITSTDSRLYPISIWDSQTGLTRQYCLPETGTRLYDGGFFWSPDSQYVALRAPLPKDEAQEGVGQHVIVLDVLNGTMTDVTTGFGPLFMWAPDPVEQQ